MQVFKSVCQVTYTNTHTYTKPAGIFYYDYIDYIHQFGKTDLNNIESSDPWISYSSLFKSLSFIGSVYYF